RDVLDLGRHLVEQLRLEPGVDTLCRWMAHHLAELLGHVSAARDGKARAAAEDRAVDLVLRIWNHRGASDRFNPIADLRPAVRVLSSLAEKEPPWVFHHDKPSQGTRRVYDSFRRLTICLALLEMQDLRRLRAAARRARTTTKFQSLEERVLVSRLAP